MVTLTNIELTTLAFKQKLIGSFPHMKNDDGSISKKEVADYEPFFSTDQLFLKFTDGEVICTLIGEKFTVDVPEIIPRINQGKVKKHKK